MTRVSAYRDARFLLLHCDNLRAILNNMKRIIQSHVFKGERQYVAEGVDLPVVTQGATLDELVRNIQEAVGVQIGAGE